MDTTSDIIAARREEVLRDYSSAEGTNNRRYLEGDERATSRYIFDNQIMDANDIVREFKENNRRVISITKRTKVGMDGLMIEVAKLMTTHPEDAFVVNPANIRIITGMSNAGWEKDMKEKSPNCFKDKIFHHGQLRNADLNNLRNALIIIDEIDTGDKEFQVLHNTLKEAGVLDVAHMEENNNRFMFASATMIKELYDLYRWGELHKLFKMTIPPNYIGHIDFLNKGIIKEFYSLSVPENADKWIKEDIIGMYNTDFRVHLVRVNNKFVNSLQNACIRAGISFRNHTSTDRLSTEEIKELFKEPLKNHIVLGVKGFFRRANLIPNMWKMRIGATHELYTKVVDNNVQIQGLPGRMTGYWRDVIEGGHKTGPHRTSIKAVEEYEKTFNDPFGLNSYQTAGFKKKKGKVNADFTMLSSKHITGLVTTDLPAIPEEVVDIKTYRIYSDESVLRNICKILGYDKPSKLKVNDDGFAVTSHHNKSFVMSLSEAVKLVPKSYGIEKKADGDGRRGRRTYLPCYVDVSDKTTLRFVVIIHPDIDVGKIQDADTHHASIPL